MSVEVVLTLPAGAVIEVLERPRHRLATLDVVACGQPLPQLGYRWLRVVVLSMLSGVEYVLFDSSVRKACPRPPG